MRGEYAVQRMLGQGAAELPPRARRILPLDLRGHLKNGTTSACAENTCGETIGGVGSGNYLRVRGEYPK